MASSEKGDRDYTLDWSTDGTSWTKIKDITVTAANTPVSIDCTVILQKALKGSFYIRSKIATRDQLYTEDWAYVYIDVK